MCVCVSSSFILDNLPMGVGEEKLSASVSLTDWNSCHVKRQIFSLSLSIGYSPIGSNRISLSFSLCIHIGFGIIPVLLIELNRFNSERLFSTRSCLYCVCLESTTIISTVYTVSWICCVHLWNRLSGYHDGWPIDYSNLDASESAQHDSLSSVQTLVVRRA